MNDYISVYITVASQNEAETIAEVLVADRLAACVNILPGMRSTYRWEGKIESAGEVALIAKSRRELFTRIEQKIKSLSSYKCTCIIAWPIVTGNKDYLKWIDDQVKLEQ